MLRINNYKHSKREFEINNSKLLNLIIDQFKLDIDTAHGIKHWRRAKEIGNYLAEYTKADIEVVNFFSYLHDAKREDEYDDLEHGSRASIFVQELYNKGLLSIMSDKQLDQLVFACKHHTDSSVKSNDFTIQTCWDADRLDFWRLGIRPDERFLNTNIAKKEETIEFASKIGDGIL